VLGKRGTQLGRVVRAGTTDADDEEHMQISRDQFFALDSEGLATLAEQVGVSLQGCQSMEQARTRLLNDAAFI
jgi:hypothetical protein